MSEKILVPVLGESITEATVAKWLKNKGDDIKVDEPIVELETDKVNLEVPSAVNGILTEINAQNGDVVKVGAVLGSIEENNIQSDEREIKKIVPKKKESNIVNLDTDKKSQSPKIFNEEDSTKKSDEDEPLILTDEIKEEKDLSKTDVKEKLSPAVRKIVVEKNIDIEKIQGSGKDGRILKGDLIDIMGISPKPSERKIKYGQEERIKMTRLRQTIAKRLKQAQENAAMLTTLMRLI